ncbi:hypothetical protein [Terriglobus saanensis]|uniref:Uncharacterized protein n=1 Tax=Terriglobus saanensis (strain ATCC BAA-1853 / DSM 23119 / SP1PR4) TaxID=401053 RepID=E8V6I7_TERSS|nr:hypothetical protein [Terriglobus saanensis]ADV82726.1 hypothetical protein AciPR4_1922 [Terriglobus saanensis SP1PR4]
MHTPSSKYLTLAALIVTATPVLTAQNPKPLPFNLPQAKPGVVALAASAKPGAGSQASALKGQYALSLRGASVGGTSPSRETTAVGSIVADGRGHITSGVLDSNSAGMAGETPVTGSYTLNADGTGTVTLNITSSNVETFTLFVSQEGGKVKSATLLESDSKAGASGSLVRQTVSGGPEGSFNFRLTGETFETSGTPNAVAVGGTVDISQGLAQGIVSFFVGDAGHDTAFVIPPVALQATLTTPDQTGRFLFTFNFTPDGGSATQVQFVGYVVDSTHFNLLPVGPPSAFLPILIGSAVQ